MMDVLARRFSNVIITPLMAKYLFVESAFDYPDLRLHLLEVTASSMSLYSPQDVASMTHSFAENRHRYALDSSWSSHACAYWMSAPVSLGTLNCDQLVEIGRTFRHDGIWGLNWALNAWSSSSPECFEQVLEHTDTVDGLIGVLEAFPAASRSVIVAVASRIRSLLNSGLKLSNAQCLRFLEASPRICGSECASPVALSLVTDVINQSLQVGSLPPNAVVAAIRSFQKMGVRSATGAMLLKYHSLIDQAGHDMWSCMVEASLAAHIQNVNTRRCLIRRGAELVDDMSLHEVQTFLDSIHTWEPMSTPLIAKTLPHRVATRVALASATVPMDQLVAFFEFVAVRNLRKAFYGVIVVSAAAIRNRQAELNLEASSRVMRLIVVEKLELPELAQRLIATAMDDAIEGRERVHLQSWTARAYWTIRLCGHYRFAPAAGIGAFTEAIIAGISTFCRRELLLLLRATMECNCRHRSLCCSVVDEILSGGGLDGATALELSILISALQFHEVDVPDAVNHVMNRAIKIINELDETE